MDKMTRDEQVFHLIKCFFQSEADSHKDKGMQVILRNKREDRWRAKFKCPRPQLSR